MDLTAQIAEILRTGGIGNYRQESRWIAAECAGSDAALRAAHRRAAGEPLQYVLGNAPFRYLTLDVDTRVLIPRPETETLVEWVLRRAAPEARVLDIGCGSGAIALAVAQERPDLRVTAVDVSADALDVAMHNAAKNGLQGKVEFIRSDLFSALAGQQFDLIAANLPYVTEAEYLTLDPEVRDFEPKLALTAPDEGLALILQVIDALDAHLSCGGAAIFELSPPQAARTAAALEAHGFKAETLLDLCGRERFVCGENNV